MKLATFTHAGDTRVGVVTDDGLVDLAESAPDLPRDMLAFLEAGADALAAARASLDGASRLPLSDVQLEAPVARPPKFLAIGLNYADHVAETGRDTPKLPLIFNKQTSCVTGPRDPVHLPRDQVLQHALLVHHAAGRHEDFHVRAGVGARVAGPGFRDDPERRHAVRDERQ